jgi:predicted NodU family carbamoyl transferase
VIPAVTHVRWPSGRLQTSGESNPRYWALIRRFRQTDGRTHSVEHVVQRE